ncbi:MAG TPA: thiamine-phosphate kinase [Desulfonatronum sp.]|nr:thiamine-phosphate kinase [Desulfonatronum sp.]
MAAPSASSLLTSEDAFLALIDRFFPVEHNGLLLGRGDDCAVLDCPSSICMSTDLFLENVHFRRSYFRPGDIGHKTLAVNISDIAAMGAVPLGFALNLMVNENLEDDFWNGFFQGMTALAAEHGLYLAGGDLSRCSCLGMAVTIWGKQAPGGRYLRRGQGRPKDALFVIGDIGLARTGLELLENDPGLAKDFPAAVQAHLRPVPRVQEALSLARNLAVRGLMDVSDGLIRDLPRFLGPDLGCRLALEPGGLHSEVLRFARRRHQDPVAWALLGGEDYALLGAVCANQWPALRKEFPAARYLGEILSNPGIYHHDNILQYKGFDHFETLSREMDS